MLRFAVVLSLSFIPFTASADIRDEAYTLLRAGNMEAGIPLLEQYYQETRDPHVAADIAITYFNGNGVPQNYGIAREYFKAAPNNGGAVHALGVMAQYGMGEPVSYKKAEAHFLKAVSLGYVEANLNLGILYNDKTQSLYDPKLVFLHWKIIADNGNAKVQSAIAAMYFEGTGVVQDKTMAFQYNSMAADQNDIN